jgi:hypothetical protein
VRDGLFCSFDPIYVEDLRSKIFLVLVKKSRERLNFMSLDLLAECGKIHLEFAPYALKYFLRILQISLNTFLVYRDEV